MRFFSTYTRLLGLFVCLLSGELQIISSENVEMYAKEDGIPLIAPSPIGPLLSIHLNMIHLMHRSMARNSSEIISSENSNAAPFKTLEEWKKFEKTIIEDSKRAVLNLPYSSSVSSNISELIQLVDCLMNKPSNYSNYQHDDVCSTDSEDRLLKIFQVLNIKFRYIYNGFRFVRKYLPSGTFGLSKNPETQENFFDYLIDKERKEEINGKFCDSESTGTKALKFYILLAKALTNACSYVKVAHMIRYQELMTANDIENADSLVRATWITREYLYTMRVLMSKTRLAFDTLYGRIKICDSYERITDSNFHQFDLRDPNVAFSLKSVDSPSGYVVTGMRWRMKNNNAMKIIYIQIQVGKFIDGMRVDRNTIKWLDIIDSNEYVRSPDIRAYPDVNGALDPGRYLTGVQMLFLDNDLRYLIKSSGTDQNGNELLEETNQHWFNNFDNPPNISFSPSKFLLDARNVVTEPPAPLGGFGVSYSNFTDNRLINSLVLYPPFYTNMADEDQFDEYAKLFELEVI